MSIAILRVFYALYICGLFLIVINRVSEGLFSNKPLKQLVKGFFLAPFYPLSIFSKKGREKLINYITKL